MRQNKPLLLVEDDRVDQLTVKRALKEINVTNPITIVENGEEALEHLRDSRNSKPSLIFLDLNMPKMNGIEFLNERSEDPQLRRIPVVVLTTSRDNQDRVESFDLGVAGYMVKPIDYIQFLEVMRTINLYWTLSELPD